MPMTLRESYDKVKISKQPMIVYASRGLFTVTSLATKRGQEIMNTDRIDKVLGVYDHNLEHSMLIEDFQAWKERFAPDE